MWGKRKEKVFRRGSWLIHFVKVINVNMVFKKHVSSENNTFWHCVVNDKVPWTSSQIAQQIQVIQEVVLQRVSKLNESVLDKK